MRLFVASTLAALVAAQCPTGISINTFSDQNCMVALRTDETEQGVIEMENEFNSLLATHGGTCAPIEDYTDEQGNPYHGSITCAADSLSA